MGELNGTNKIINIHLLLFYTGGSNGMPPRYLSVEGHRECLSSHTANPQDTFKSICIPKAQPKACLGNSWMKLIDMAQNGMIQRCNNEMKGEI